MYSKIILSIFCLFAFNSFSYANQENFATTAKTLPWPKITKENTFLVKTSHFDIKIDQDILHVGFNKNLLVIRYNTEKYLIISDVTKESIHINEKSQLSIHDWLKTVFTDDLTPTTTLTKEDKKQIDSWLLSKSTYFQENHTVTTSSKDSLKYIRIEKPINNFSNNTVFLIDTRKKNKAISIIFSGFSNETINNIIGNTNIREY